MAEEERRLLARHHFALSGKDSLLLYISLKKKRGKLFSFNYPHFWSTLVTLWIRRSLRKVLRGALRIMCLFKPAASNHRMILLHLLRVQRLHLPLILLLRVLWITASMCCLRYISLSTKPVKHTTVSAKNRERERVRE